MERTLTRTLCNHMVYYRQTGRTLTWTSYGVLQANGKEFYKDIDIMAISKWK